MPKLVLVDTNIFISFDRAKSNDLAVLLQQQADLQLKIVTCPHVEYEYYFGMNTEKKRQLTQQLLAPFDSLLPTREITFQSADLSREYHIEPFDAFIAATCLYYRCELATHNRRHFQEISGLRFWERPLVF